MKLNFITDQGSILESTSWASRRASGVCLRALWVDGDVGGTRLVLGLVLTDAATAAAVMALGSLPVWSGFRFFVTVPNCDLSLDARSSERREAVSVAGGALLATMGPGICAVVPAPAVALALAAPAAPTWPAALSAGSMKPLPEGE
jgi:hypothetical protein